MHSTWVVGPDSAQAVTRVQASGRAARFAKEACGCAVVCARRLGPSQCRTIITCRLCFADWQHGEEPSARQLQWHTTFWSLLITSCETPFVTATLDQITSTSSTRKACVDA